MDTYWMRFGACAEQDPAIFFPGDGVGVELAKEICARCRVRQQCLDYALAERIEQGVWGGTSERQRVRIRRSREHQTAAG